jgi:threonine dehydrogenase-like Zn-dependent dehydrogenase
VAPPVSSGRGEALVRVTYSGIFKTDLEIARGTPVFAARSVTSSSAWLGVDSTGKTCRRTRYLKRTFAEVGESSRRQNRHRAG